jgi:hypothetical protein
MSESFNLQKFLWSEEDFEQMNWRKATVYAFAFLPKRVEFVLDIDYVLQQMNQPESQPNFLVTPATLVFENACDLRIELEPNREIEIVNIERDESKWTIETNQGSLTFAATGFKLHFKGMPVFGRNHALDLDFRGGFSFSRVNE